MTVQLILKIVVFESICIGGFLLVKKHIHHSKLEVHNEVAGFIYAVVGVIYAVLLAFVVVTVWDEYTDAEQNTNEEASHVIDVYRSAGVFPDSISNIIQHQAVVYLEKVVAHEWDAMDNNQISGEAKAAYLQLWETVRNFKPKTDCNKLWYAELISEMNYLADARRYRIDSIYYSIAFFMWFLLYAGAFITIGFSYMFGTKNKIAHLIMTICLSGSICLVLVMVEALEHPFTGIIHVTPEAIIRALEQLQ